MLKYSNNEVAKSFVRLENAKHMLPTTATSEEIMQRAEEKDIVDFVERAMLRKDFTATASEKIGIPGYGEEVAKSIYDALPEEMLTNVREWCGDKSISDIDYHGISVNKILTWNPNCPLTVLQAFDLIVMWNKLNRPPVQKFLNEATRIR